MANTKAILGGKLMFPSEFLAAIEFKGKDVTLTIKSIKVEELKMQGGKKDRKPVLSFNGTNKKLILNKTNAGTIADMHGAVAEKWVGQKITLYPTRTHCGGDMVDCVRVRPGAPKPGTATAADLPEPEPREEEDTIFGAAADDAPSLPDEAPPESNGDAWTPSGLLDAIAEMGTEREMGDFARPSAAQAISMCSLDAGVKDKPDKWTQEMMSEWYEMAQSKTKHFAYLALEDAAVKA